MSTPHNATAYPTDHLYIHSPKEHRVHNENEVEAARMEYGLSARHSYAAYKTLTGQEPEPEEPEGTLLSESEERKPDETWLKADIQAWLTDHGIDFFPTDTKAELLTLIPE